MRETPRDEVTKEPFHTRATEVEEKSRTNSVGDLLKELTDESRTLVRQEVELVKVEMSEKIDHLTSQATSMAVGGAIAFAGLIVLLFAISEGMTALFAQFMSAELAIWLGPLVLAIVLAVIGYSMINSAKEKMRETSLRPEKAAYEARETKNWAKEKARNG